MDSCIGASKHLGGRSIMNQSNRVFSLLLLTIFLNSVGFAAETSPSKEPPKESATKSPPKKKTTKTKKPKVQKFVGDISAVDNKSGAVSVKGTAGEKNFVTQDAAKDAVERLSVGDRVRVQYSEKEGKLVATSVRRVKLPQTKTKPAEESTKSKIKKAPDQQKQSKDAVK